MSEYTAVFFIFLPCTMLLVPVGCYMIGQLEGTKGGGEGDTQGEGDVEMSNRNDTIMETKNPDHCAQTKENESKKTDLPDVIVSSKNPDGDATPKGGHSGDTKSEKSLPLAVTVEDIEAHHDNNHFMMALKLCCQLDVVMLLLTVLVSGLAASVFLTFSYVYTKVNLLGSNR